MTDMMPMGEMGETPAPSRPQGPQPKPITAREVKERWDKGIKAVAEERHQAAINDRFLRNKHWITWNRGSQRLEELPRDPSRVRATIAKIGPDSGRLIAKLTARPLSFEVPPRSPDDAAMRASRTAEAALAQTQIDQDWEDIRYDHARVVWAGGVGGLAVDWDYEAGTELGVGEDGSPIYTGEVCVKAVSIHEMSFEPGTRNAYKARYWTHAVALPPPEVQATYNLPTEPKADARPIDTVWRSTEGEREQHTPMTMVYTYYERPSGPMYPGRVVAVVGNEIVQESSWPFPFTDHLNISLAVVEPIHGRWYGHTWCTDAVPIQTAMNASWSSLIEHAKLAGNARYQIPEGSIDDPEDMSDTPGEFTYYRPINGMKPAYESPPVLPDWLVRMPSELGQVMDGIVGQFDVSRGQAPTNVESGIGLQILSENADTPIGRFARNLGDCWARAASMVLELYQAHVDEKREAIIKMPDSDIPEMVEWNGDMLQGHTRVTIPDDAIMPRNRSAQAAYAFQLFDRGIIRTPEELAKIADLPDRSDLIDGVNPDSAKARRENQYMANGQAPPVDPGADDHANHLAIHRAFRQSQRYEQLPPKVQQTILDHMTAHEIMAAEAWGELTQAAAMSPLAASLPSESPNRPTPDEVAEGMALSEVSQRPPMQPGMGPPMMEPGMGVGAGEPPLPPDEELPGEPM